MSEYPVPYQIKGGKCCVPCPNGMKGRVLDVVMLGSEFCRVECKYSGDKTRQGGKPVLCRYTEVNQ
jgi:hypothetical protein